MENTSYGINVANRYDLFCIDDDAGDPMEAILKNKQKQQKKQQQQAAAASAGATGAAPAAAAAAGGAQSAAAKSNAKGGEKENKAAGGRGAENRHPDKSASQTNGNLHNQRGGTERNRGIKETQKDNIRSNQESQKTAGGGQGAKFPRGNGPSGNKNGTVAPGGGGGDDKYPRKPREFDDGQRRPYVQNGGGAGGPKRFDGRGKRELDRQSGSNKTGIKAVDKRDGAGSHNWGSSKQDAKEFSNLQDQDYQPQDADTSADEKANADRTNVTNGGEGGGEGADGAANAKEDEAKEMTLDEWKAQKAAVRLKPQYNLRKAGEGEDSAQWDKMVALDKKSAKDEARPDGEAADDETNNDTQKASAGGGGKSGKHVLEIEFHFNDNRRGGLGRSRGGRGGRGGGGGRGMGRDGGPGGRRGGDFGGGGGGENNYRSGGGRDGGDHGYNNHHHQDGGAGGGGQYDGGMERPQRDNMRRNNRPPLGGGGGGGGPERNYDGGMNNSKYSRPNPRASKQQHAPAAPKVDDEHDFPSLG